MRRCRFWTRFERERTQTWQLIVISRKNIDFQHSGAKEKVDCVECWTPINNPIIMARYHSKFIKTSVITRRTSVCQYPYWQWFWCTRDGITALTRAYLINILPQSVFKGNYRWLWNRHLILIFALIAFFNSNS